MKKYILILFCAGFFAVFSTSCFKDYLDKAPESGLTEEEVFSKYENFKSFFDAVYNGTQQLNGTGTYYNFNIRTAYPFYFTLSDLKYTWECLTDMSDMGRGSGLAVKGGSMQSTLKWYTTDRVAPILSSMFIDIRICNMVLKNIGMLKDVKQEDIDDFIAQAHFVRAFAHFELFRLWGPMPYVTKVLGPDDQWDIPRLSKHETLLRIAADMDTAATYFAKANRMRRDPGPGVAGHLNSPDQARPNGVAAKAYRGRALLYAASPLNNELGVKDWEEAAKANWEAIEIAEQYGYALVSAADYKTNYVGVKYTNEQLWAWNAGTKSYTGLQAIMNGVFGSSKSGNTAECPTQNVVDRFETKWGDPLNTDADRLAAAALGHYNEQNPYKDRDPRFYIDVIYNTAPIPGYGTAKIYFEMLNGVINYSELLDPNYQGITKTGYYQRKLWGEQSVKNKTTPQHTDPLSRLGELYLNYAEAANEAYGPNGAAPNSPMTAVQAVNKIRNRVGMSNVQPQVTASKESFRPRIKNERIIELCFEGHYYHDIRRWKDAPAVMSSTLMGVVIEKVPVNTTYPTGYRYTRMPLTSDRQPRWKEAMYYFPFPTEDNYKMKNFVPNEVW